MNKYRENMKLLQLDKEKMMYRWNMVMHTNKTNISETAREYKTTRKTVKKWVERYKREGIKGLKNRSRLNQKHPDKMPENINKSVIKTRKKFPFWGARRIKESLSLSYSHTTIHKKIKQAGLVKKKKRRYKRRREMSALRKRYKPFEKLQIDVKYLTDIPEFYPGIRFNNLPKYEITARDYCTGSVFLSYTYEKSSTSTGIYIDYLCHVLEKYGIDISNISFQTDNGKEFTNYSQKRDSIFHHIVENKYKGRHKLIPLSRPTYNSDVESFHRLIEDEFYRVEEFIDLKDFLYKSFSYQVYFNNYRKNRYRNNSSPREILKRKNKNIDEMMLNIPPIIPDNYIDNIEYIKKGGYLWCGPPTYDLMIKLI